MPPAITANPPGPSVVAGRPVISARIVPLIIRICSCAVWECQGTTHSEGAFRIKVDGPAAGLPVSMAEDRHLTSLSARNCTDGSGASLPIAGPWARAVPAAKVATQPIRVQPGRDFTAVTGRDVDQELGLGKVVGEIRRILYPACSSLTASASASVRLE